MSLSPQDLLDLERRLRDRRAAVIDELRRETRDDEGLLRLPDHREDGDRSVGFEMEAVDLAQSLRDAGELQGIDAALQRLGDGSYGLCPDCGEAIDDARLRAEPAALRCAACQQRFEHRHPPA